MKHRWLMGLVALTAAGAALITAGGCQRNATFNDSVSFEGTVYYGHSSSNTVINDGVLPNARVICEGYPDYALSDAAGRYTLNIGAVRTFNHEGSDAYIIKALGPDGGTSKTTVYGKPGDTLQVPNFIIFQYTEEE